MHTYKIDGMASKITKKIVTLAKFKQLQYCVLGGKSFGHCKCIFLYVPF